jgi:hypothetical protein
MTRTHIRRAAAIAALALAAAPGVWAQERPAEFQTYMTPGLTFTPGISLSGVWDSNVALASPVGRPASDNLFVVEPFGQLELVTTRTELVAGYKGYVRRYLEVDELNGFDQRGYLSLRRLATPRLTFFVRDEFADVPTTDEVQLNGLPFARTGSKSNRLAAGIESRLGKYTDLNVRYENTWVKFDRPDTFLSDGWINAIQSDLRRRLSERLSVGVEYGIRRADLEQGQRTIWFQDAGGLVAYAIGPHTTVTASGGFSMLNDSRLDRDRRGPYVRGDLVHDTERATVGLSVEKSFVPSFGFGGSSDSQEVRGYLRMPLSRNRLYVQSTALWRRTDPLILEELHLDTIQTHNTLGFALVRWLRLEAFHVFTRQDSRLTGGEINRQRAGVQIVVTQPMRIR